MAGLVHLKVQHTAPRVWKENWLCLPIRTELISTMWAFCFGRGFGTSGLWDTIAHQVVLVRWEALCKINPSLALFNIIKPLRRFPICNISTGTFKMLIPILYAFSWLLRSLWVGKFAKTGPLTNSWDAFLSSQICLFSCEPKVL